MGSRRGPEQTIGQQNFKMKFLLVLCLLGLVAGSEDYKMFMKWAKTKAMESCWGEDNMKLYTVNMKKAVAKCHQVDAPELDLAPFRAANRFVNNLVKMDGHHEDDSMEDLKFFMRFSKLQDMMNQQSHHSDSYDNMKTMLTAHKFSQMMDDYNEPRFEERDNMMETMKLIKMMRGMENPRKESENDHNIAAFFRTMGKKTYRDEYDDQKLSSLLKSFTATRRYKRQADDSLALNDRLKEKLVGMMEEHVNMVSNMTCVLKELNVIDHNNNVDLAALKEDSKQYKMPSQWFGDKYEEILDGCYEVSENLPASLQEKYVPSNYNGPMRNLGKIKSFMNCSKSAKMKLCMNQDTKKKIEANFGPVEKLVEGFNNQLTEDQVFFMVNQLLEGSEEDQYM